ncbi:hypothetical protein BS17DRAFT_445900 [Gyrodon lividus]|nr:hypothetical protein BS17DRAFT_445900 [Gyrodon lividus]
MINVECQYCNKAIPQFEYNPHIRENHTPPSEKDRLNLMMKYYPQRMQQKLTPAKKKSTPKSRSGTSTSNGTLVGSATSSPAKPSTLFAAWKESDLGLSRNNPYITTDDVSSFRVDRSDQLQTAAQSLRKYDIQELVHTFRGLKNEDRDECFELVRSLPVFPALGGFCLHAPQVMCVRQAKVFVDA